MVRLPVLVVISLPIVPEDLDDRNKEIKDDK